MPDTIREQIIAAFTVRAAALTSNTIERARRAHDENGFLNVSVWDGEDAAESEQFGSQTLSFPIALNMQWVAKENPSIEANALMGEVVKSMAGSDSEFGGLAEKMQYVSATPEYPADGSGMVSLTVIFNIFYATVKGDPFTAVN